VKNNSFTRANWITSIGDDKFLGFESTDSAQRRLKTLLDLGWYLFAENTPGRKRMKPGDRLCFYLKRVGVVAETELDLPARFVTPELREFIRARFNCPFRLRASRTFFENPIVLDLELRSRLDGLKGRNLAKWQWFVQMTHKVSARDFALLTHSKSDK
jgi:hypothetical protein